MVPTGERINPRSWLLNFQVFSKNPSKIIHHKLLVLLCTCCIASHLHVGSLTGKALPLQVLPREFLIISSNVTPLRGFPSFLPFLPSLVDLLHGKTFLAMSFSNHLLQIHPPFPTKHGGFKQPPLCYWSEVCL